MSAGTTHHGGQTPTNVNTELPAFLVPELRTNLRLQVSETQMVDLFVENDGLDQQRGVVYLYHLRKRPKGGGA